MELIILLLIILLFFGTKRIPTLAISLGGGIREFRKGASGEYEEAERKEKQLPVNEKADSEETTPKAEGAVFAEQKKS